MNLDAHRESTRFEIGTNNPRSQAARSPHVGAFKIRTLGVKPLPEGEETKYGYEIRTSAPEHAAQGGVLE